MSFDDFGSKPEFSFHFFSFSDFWINFSRVLEDPKENTTHINKFLTEIDKHDKQILKMEITCGFRIFQKSTLLRKVSFFYFVF